MAACHPKPRVRDEGERTTENQTTMALTESQQIQEMIKRSDRPLICVAKGAGSDGFASAIGLAEAIQKLDKPVEIVSAQGPAPKQLKFLKKHCLVRPTIESLEKFTIKLNINQTKVEELSYNIEGDELHIHLIPKSGIWADQDINTAKSGYRYDLIISLGASDLTAHDHIFHNHAEFFFTTPIINLDHSPANEHYGQLNLVDTTATAISEVAHNLIQIVEPNLIDEEVSTALLAGMIAKTKSFKTANVTPRTLKIASMLMSYGARRDEIVENLFRTRSVETLRLWGRALARLKSHEHSRLVWTLLGRSDFMHAGANEDDLPDVVDELIASSPHAKVVILMYEDREGNVCAILRAEEPHDAMTLAAPFRPAGTRDEVRLCFMDQTIMEVEKNIVAKIKEQLAE